MVTYLRQKQSGRSMIEMLGVLAIVGVLSAGGIAGYSMAMQSYKTSALIEKVNLVAQQARVLYEGGQYTDADIDDKLTEAGMITDLTNPFGGDLTVKATGATEADPVDEFTVTTPANVPAEACVKLLRTDWGTTGVFTSIKVGSNEYTSADKTSPVDADAAISACDSGNKAIEWVFK